MVVMLDVVVVIIISLSPPSLYKPRNTQFRCGSFKLRINVTVHQDFVYQIHTFQSTAIIMQSARETAARFGETVQQKMPSTLQPQQGRSKIPDWNTEEKLETTLDKDGNPVPDRSFTDGEKMMKGSQGPDEADAYEAATADFK
jgi:hypothetical protein